MKNHLPEETHNKILSTYARFQLQNNWNALFIITKLFRNFVSAVADNFKFRYNKTEGTNFKIYLKQLYRESRINSLAKYELKFPLHSKINVMKTKKFIRNGPHLPVKNLRQTLDFYRDTLGFYDEWTFGNKDGGITRDDMQLLFAEDPEFVNDINNHHHRLPLMWFVDNIDAIFSEFQERDIEIADTLKTHPYGLREFAFIDINGYYIRIAEGIEEE